MSANTDNLVVPGTLARSFPPSQTELPTLWPDDMTSFEIGQAEAQDALRDDQQRGYPPEATRRRLALTLQGLQERTTRPESELSAREWARGFLSVFTFESDARELHSCKRISSDASDCA